LTVVGKQTQIPAGFESRRPTMFDTHLSPEAVRAGQGVLSEVEP
jgi:hypothetical protein